MTAKILWRRLKQAVATELVYRAIRVDLKQVLFLAESIVETYKKGVEQGRLNRIEQIRREAKNN